VLRAITFDYWDTLYVGASHPERVARRRTALFQLAGKLGAECSWDEFVAAYHESAVEFERVWHSGRGYRTHDRILWLLERLGVDAGRDGERITAAAVAVDDTMVDHPPALLPGAADSLGALRSRYRLAIVSDTGFASGQAQNRVLANDGLLAHFTATIYSMDVGRAKPSPQMFSAAREALCVDPHEVLHVGDNERTDIGGALAAGMRAVRLDAVRDGGPSAAEFVARSLPALTAYLLEKG
jgi:HAD superfamily hydrolase (TIGR01509 family)